jgi:type IV secretory pathway VirB4 component
MDGCVLAHGHKGREKKGMELFERLVNEQLKTMEQLLFLQSEIERCQEIEKQLIELQQEAKLQSLQEEIRQMKQQLKEIQQTFEKQTEEVILAYQNQHRRMCEPSSAW